MYQPARWPLQEVVALQGQVDHRRAVEDWLAYDQNSQDLPYGQQLLSPQNQIQPQASPVPLAQGAVPSPMLAHDPHNAHHQQPQVDAQHQGGTRQQDGPLIEPSPAQHAEESTDIAASDGNESVEQSSAASPPFQAPQNGPRQPLQDSIYGQLQDSSVNPKQQSQAPKQAAPPLEPTGSDLGQPGDLDWAYDGQQHDHRSFRSAACGLPAGSRLDGLK